MTKYNIILQFVQIGKLLSKNNIKNHLRKSFFFGLKLFQFYHEPYEYAQFSNLHIRLGPRCLISCGNGAPGFIMKRGMTTVGF